MNRTEVGSKTAKGGFANEKAICEKFNNWKNDTEAKEWLKIMGYDIKKLKSVKAIHVPIRIKKPDLSNFGITEEGYEQFVRFKKVDVQIKVIIKIVNLIKIENLSLKKANSDADYNQVDKRTVNDYQEMWGFPDEIAFYLKLFTGELDPTEHSKMTGIHRFRDKRRLFLDEMKPEIQRKIIDFFEANRIMVISDIMKGRDGLSVNWMLVTRFNRKNETTTWTLRDINFAMNFFGNGKICLSPKGSLYIGKITMQRKGGTPDPTKLQFKIKPCQLFNAGN